jgi:hypothetical protein
MKKNIVLNLFFAAAVAIVSLSALSWNAAACIAPDCFATPSGYQVETFRGENGELPFPVLKQNEDGTVVAARYEYRITGSGTTNSAVSQIAIQIPVSELGDIEVVDFSPEGLQIYAVTEGDKTTGFGIGDPRNYVVKWTFRVNPGDESRFWIETTPAFAGPTVMALKVGKNLESGLILGPSLEEAPPQLAQTKVAFTVADENGTHNIEITLDQFGNVSKVEVDGVDKTSEGREQEEVYVCLPLADGELPEGEVRMLPNQVTGEDANYDCQNISATLQNQATTLKTGINTSCPTLIGGRWYDFCK